MARLWSSGFELQSVTAGIEFDNVTVTGTISIDTTIKHGGSASLKCVTSGSPGTTAFVDHTYGNTTQNVQYHRFFLYIDTALDATDTIYRIRNGSTNELSVKMNSTGSLSLVDEANGSTPTTIGTSSALSTATWHRIEVSLNYSTGATTLRINGTDATSGTFTLGVAAPDRAQMGHITTSAGTMYFDDWAINDNSGSSETSYPGDGYILHLKPNAAGDNNAWELGTGAAGTTSNYLAVNETTPDDATSTSTYLIRSVSGQPIDDYNIESATGKGIGASDTIKFVAVGARIGSNSGTQNAAREITFRLKSASGGTVTEVADNRCDTNGFSTFSDVTPRIYRLISYTDPTTGSAWTATGTNSLENAQIGAKPDTNTNTHVRLGTIWALVEYVPSGGGGGGTAVKDMIAMGILPAAR